MGVRSVLLVAVLLGARAAAADGVCVTIDVTRDNLSEGDRAGVRSAVASALVAEGVALDPSGTRCTSWVSASSIRIDRRVTTTITAGDKHVSGDASSLDEVDLLIRQLVRSLVTGRSMATGSGVTDRQNVLRDQTAPRRTNGARVWEPVFAIGGGVLQLPGIAGRPRQRQSSIVALESRWWAFADERSAFEIMGRLLVHDYAVFGDAYDNYDDASDDPTNRREAAWAFGLAFSWMAVANWEAGLGFVKFGGDRPPRPFVRLGVSMSLLCRFSDPDHRFDVGFGGYGGLGFQFTKHVGVSVAVNASNPLVHDFLDRGYRYFATATALLEIKLEGDRRSLGPFPADPVPTIHRINE